MRGCCRAGRARAGLGAALVASIELASACQHDTTPELPLSPRASDMPTPQRPGGERWPRFAEARSWKPVVSLDETSHFSDPVQVAIRVNPGARAAFEGLVPGQTLAAGTTLTATHALPSGRRSTYVMEKTGPDSWRFRVLEGAGGAVSKDTYPCRRCHSEAPTDWVFPLPETVADGGT